MEYKKAEKLKKGDVVEPRNKDVHGVLVQPHGDYLVKDIRDDGHTVTITLDNGQEITHKMCNHPPILQALFGGTFYCSWYGLTDNITKTGLSKEQIERCGILVDESDD